MGGCPTDRGEQTKVDCSGVKVHRDIWRGNRDLRCQNGRTEKGREVRGDASVRPYARGAELDEPEGKANGGGQIERERNVVTESPR